jgi:hypothetical protein
MNEAGKAGSCKPGGERLANPGNSPLAILPCLTARPVGSIFASEQLFDKLSGQNLLKILKLHKIEGHRQKIYVVNPKIKSKKALIFLFFS